MPKVRPIPKGYSSITPYLVVDGADKAIAYYKKVFGAKEIFRMPAPGGKIGHAEIRIGDSVVMLADEWPQMGFKGPKAYGGAAVSILLYVEKCDAVYKKALANGGTEIKPMQDQFYGDRSGTFIDPFGHMWTVATHVKDVSPKDMKKAAAAMAKG
jgi:PhnB protein